MVRIVLIHNEALFPRYEIRRQETIRPQYKFQSESSGSNRLQLTKCEIVDCPHMFHRRERGKGRQKYCEEHAKIIRKRMQKIYSRRNYLKRLAYKC